MMKVTVLVVTIFIFLALSSPLSGAVFTPKQGSDLEETVHAVMKCKNLPGLTLAVVKGNETWTKGFGVADEKTGRPVTSSTLFGIGSLTKSFTATLLAMLMGDNRRYSWEAPVARILGDDFKMGDDYVTSHVTLNDLLTHRTGLSTDPILFFTGSPPNLTRAELEKRIRYLPTVAPFRDRFAYNNWMYTLAGRVAEVMGGASWEDLLLTRILQPLGMSDTRVLGKNVEADADNLALPYMKVGNDVVLSDPSLYRLSPMEPAGGIASSADDMIKWLKFHMSKGQTPGGSTIVSESRMQEMHTAHVLLQPETVSSNIFQPQFPASSVMFGYGYGWFDSVYGGHRVLLHGGSLFAYRSYITILPDDDIGIFISSTGSAGNAVVELFYYMADVLLGRDPWLNTTTVCTFPAPWLTVHRGGTYRGPTPAPGSIANSDHVMGVYGNPLFGDVEIFTSGTGHLGMKFNQLVANLHKTDKANVFLAEAVGGRAFVSHAGSITVYYTITFINQNSDTDSRYQALQIQGAAVKETLTFRRDVRFCDPVPDKTSPGGATSLGELLEQDV